MKPGKEASRKKRNNPNDMLPQVGSSKGMKKDFRDLWSPIAQLSISDYEAFKAVLVLIYRDTFLLDHVEHGNSLRYSPSKGVLACMDRLDAKVRETYPPGLMEMLCEVDILGWNEDVKYHVEDGRVVFKGKYDSKVGRINNMLTCITVSCELSEFLRRDSIVKSRPDYSDFDGILKICQRLIIGRGVAPPTNRELIGWLDPFIYE